ncbi:hypothetical protein [Corynebacterium argentoratense]|nr:hypothetical protein [Corynebacterium argentoratense]MCF1712415.1 hypothetical protein [Corynebacterium argentoratense]
MPTATDAASSPHFTNGNDVASRAARPSEIHNTVGPTFAPRGNSSATAV